MTMLITGVAVWLVRLPVAILLTRPFGLFGAWVGMGLDINARGFLMWLRFRGDHWTSLRV
jgi:Na+-driven multidrug efflux pump